MNLDILIPTYNRSSYLIKNIAIIHEIASKLPNACIRVIVSDNASTDDTKTKMEDYICAHPKLTVLYYRQNDNIGFCGNLIYTLSKSDADYVLTLGDDDYINFDYMSNALKAIEEDSEIKCVLPSFQAINERGDHLSFGRDLGGTRKIYSAGAASVCANAGRAHQISGIILKREGLLDALRNAQIDNLYPQIFLTSYSCLNGKCLHLPEYPVLVTQTEKKAWNYDDVGLLNDIFQNYARVGMKGFDRFSAEKEMLRTQRWRALRYWKNPIKQLKVIAKISYGHNTSVPGKFLIPPMLIYYWSRWSVSNILRKISGCR